MELFTTASHSLILRSIIQMVHEEMGPAPSNWEGRVSGSEHLNQPHGVAPAPGIFRSLTTTLEKKNFFNDLEK